MVMAFSEIKRRGGDGPYSWNNVRWRSRMVLAISCGSGRASAAIDAMFRRPDKREHLVSDTRTASCNCGAIRIEARGELVRVGLCHCSICRKESGTPFTVNAIWCADDVTVKGNTASWRHSTDARHFCPLNRPGFVGGSNS